MADVATSRARQRSMVSREPGFVIWFRRVVLRRKPVLYHFEVHLTDHCNLNCKGCSHFSNLCPPSFADLGEFEADMERMAGIFSKVTQIHLLGGEPLLHPRVAEFCRVARDHFPRTRICLVTNGTLVSGMKADFWTALHDNKIVLRCNSYPIDLAVSDINLKAAASRVKIEWTDPNRQLLKIPIDPAGRHDAASSFKGCRGLNNRPILRDGRLYPCAYIAYAEVFRERFGVGDLEVYPTDYIGIRDSPDPEQVFSFLRNPVHWCTNCDMDNREPFEWGRSSGDIGEWTTWPSRS